jgi:SsrA-binding protein
MNIQEYSHGNINNHDPLRIRKLLLQRRELNKIEKSVKDTGITLVPLVLFINEKGLAKVEIGVCRGKKMHDKRHQLKEKSLKREMDRAKR